MARCIHKVKAELVETEKTAYKFACDWGSHHNNYIPNPYKTVDGPMHMQFIYLDKGDCKNCPCKRIAW